MNLNKFGIKTLILSVGAYIFASYYSVTWFLNLLTEPNTDHNILGFVGLLMYVVCTIAYIKPFRILMENSNKDINNLFGPQLVFLIAISSIFTSTGCMTRIDPGYVGIRINLSGSDKGVQNYPLVNGWQFYLPMSTRIVEYPTFVQTAVWTKDANEGSPINEEITFNSVENLGMAADISLSYSIKREKVPTFYEKYRSDNLAVFTHGIMRNVSRDAFNEVAGHYAVEDILGPKKELFLTEVKNKINAQMSSVGIVIDQFGFIGAPRPPATIVESINAKIKATQYAMKAENELRTSEAEAKKLIAKTEGEAKAQIARAEGAAKAKISMAEGEAKANQLLTQSITPSLLEWRRLAIQEQAVNKWDGKRPSVEGASSGMLLQIDAK